MNQKQASYFDASHWSFIGRALLAGLMSIGSCGFASAWAICMLERWKVGHTVINGRRLKFTGSGGELFGRNLLWSFLTVVTCGVYGIWYHQKLKIWMTERTAYEDTGANIGPSQFTGGAFRYFINVFLVLLVFYFSLGFASPFLCVWALRWEADHTYIGGKKLIFTGEGGPLLGKSVVWNLLTCVTFFIYGFFVPVSYLRWYYEHLETEPDPEPEPEPLPVPDNTTMLQDACIVGVTGPCGGYKFDMAPGEELIIGKDAKVAQILIDTSYREISRKHVGVCYDVVSDQYRVVDYSTNGTWANGCKLENGKEYYFDRGTELKLANDKNTFVLG